MAQISRVRFVLANLRAVRDGAMVQDSPNRGKERQAIAEGIAFLARRRRPFADIATWGLVRYLRLGHDPASSLRELEARMAA